MISRPLDPESLADSSSANLLGNHHQSTLDSPLSTAPCNTPNMPGTITAWPQSTIAATFGFGPGVKMILGSRRSLYVTTIDILLLISMSQAP